MGMKILLKLLTELVFDRYLHNHVFWSSCLLFKLRYNNG